jgi:pimeloyl-ACP methyl ester carboxylesterase
LSVRGSRALTGSAWNDRYFRSADALRLHYRDYPAAAGAAARLPVLCLPGLTRNSRDFEALALHVQRTRRVLSPDLRGRGRSQRDPNWQNYQPAVYLSDLAALLADAGVGRVVIIGTSLGGLLAMLIGAARPATVAGIVLNDIGPEIDPRGGGRIASYVGRNPPVRNWDEAAAQARATYGVALPDLPESAWPMLARRAFVEVDGVPQLDMDPMIGEAVRNAAAGPRLDLWSVYAGLAGIPMLAFRGVLSDVLSAETFARMVREHPQLVAVEVPGRGHPPLLDEPECIAAIDGFLSRLP